jgi:hypothetical protein
VRTEFGVVSDDGDGDGDEAVIVSAAELGQHLNNALEIYIQFLEAQHALVIDGSWKQLIDHGLVAVAVAVYDSGEAPTSWNVKTSAARHWVMREMDGRQLPAAVVR